MKNFNENSIYFVTILLSLPLMLSGQNTSIGKNFVVCYPKIEDFGGPNKDPIIMSIYIMQYSDDTTNANIKYYYKNKFIDTNLIILPHQIYHYLVPPELELLLLDTNENKGIYLETNNDVVVVCLSSNYAKAETYLVYPETMLDSFYVISTQPNMLYSQQNFSEVNIAAIEDNTMIKVIPACQIYNSDTQSKDTFSFQLNKFETKRIQAAMGDDNDLTGSIINADKKIAVFSSHNSTSIPTKLKSSSNYIIEQNIPVPYLGNQELLTPFYHYDSDFTSKARIVPVFDSTNISFNNQLKLINRFDFLEIDYDSAIYIISDKPILCASYKINCPSMVFIPTPEQFLNSYKFYSPNYYVSRHGYLFNEHFVNITIDSNFIKTIKLDSSFLSDTNQFIVIPETKYKWAYVRVDSGLHEIYADTTFGLIVYGDGGGNGYSYNGGMKADRLLEKIMDKNKPQFINTESCKSTVGFNEYREYDSGIDSINVIDSSNAKLILPQFDIGSKQINLSSELIDESKDGNIIIECRDVAGNKNYDTLQLKGFTISQSYKSKPEYIIFVVNTDYLTITNYGSYEQKLSLRLKNNIYFSIPPTIQDINVPPNSSINVPVCIYSNLLGNISDVIKITDDCGRVQTHEIKVLVEKDIYEGNAVCGPKLVLKSFTNQYIIKNSSSYDIYGYSGKYLIYDILGRAIEEKSITNDVTIDLEYLTAGNYIFILRDNSNQIIYRDLFNIQK